jgi:hypothetical protein
MHGRLRSLQPATDRSTTRLFVTACAVALLLPSVAATGARASVIGEEELTAAFSCSGVTYTFTHFPAAPVAVRELIKVGTREEEAQPVAETEFTFQGPETSNTLAAHVPPGRHTMDAKASWKIGTEHGSRDIKLAGGITCPAAPDLALEKRQRVPSSSEPFTSATLSGFPGEPVDYQITAVNTGNVALTLTSFADANCDPGTLGGGPAGALAPGASVSYSCQHALTAADRQAGTYTNTASVAASWSEGGSGELTRTSNTVVVDVGDPPPPPPPVSNPPPSQLGSPSPLGGPGGIGGIGGVLAFGQSGAAARCALSLVRRKLSVDNRGRVSLRLALAGAGTCRGKLSLTVKRRAAHSRPSVQTIATRTFSLPAGRSSVLTLALNKLGRALLHAGRGHLGATLRTLRLSPGPPSAHSASVSLSARHTK